MLTRLERRWYVRGYLPADAAPATDNEFDQSDPFFSECLMVACMRCGRAVFNNYGANEKIAWLMRANESNALPILGLYTQRPPPNYRGGSMILGRYIYIAIRFFVLNLLLIPSVTTS